MKENDARCDGPDPGPDPGPGPVLGMLSLNFVYEHNTARADRFADEVEYIDLFVFDGDEKLYLAKELPVSGLDAGNSVALDIPAGDYTVVAWGNSDSDDYSFVYGSSLAEMSLMQAYEPDGLVTSHPGHLFHGMASFSFTGQNDLRPTVYMYKNTSRVRVVFDGLEPAEQQQWTDMVDVWINGSNAVYGFDRALRESELLRYAPVYNTAGRSDMQYEAIFTVQRITEDGDMTLTSLQWGYEQPIIHVSLPELIKEGYGGDDFPDYLEREDDFTLKLTLNRIQGGKYVVARVQVNNWNPIDYDNVGI